MVVAATSRGSEVEALREQLARTTDLVAEANERTGAANAARLRTEGELRALRSAWDGIEVQVSSISREAQSRLDEADGRILAAVTRAKAAERRSAEQGAEICQLRLELKRCSIGLEKTAAAKQRHAKPLPDPLPTVSP